MQVELVEQLLLPLVDQTPGGDDQTSREIAAKHQLLDVQAGHDGLVGTEVFCEQEPQRCAGQQLAVDGLELVRQRLELAGADGGHRVEPGGHPDPQRLRRQPELSPVPVEGPCGGEGTPRVSLAAAGSRSSSVLVPLSWRSSPADFLAVLDFRDVVRVVMHLSRQPVAATDRPHSADGAAPDRVRLDHTVPLTGCGDHGYCPVDRVGFGNRASLDRPRRDVGTTGHEHLCGRYPSDALHVTTPRQQRTAPLYLSHCADWGT